MNDSPVRSGFLAEVAESLREAAQGGAASLLVL
jgi:hypothetical protein